MMDKIITEVERDPHYRHVTDTANPIPQANISDVICDALHRSAAILPLAALVSYTTSGVTSLRTARVEAGGGDFEPHPRPRNRPPPGARLGHARCSCARTDRCLRNR
jgi:hypothetical protein